LTTPSFITVPPSGSPFKHQDSATPFTWNSVVFPERSFSTTVTRDLSLLEVNGQVQVVFSKSAQRNISWNAETYKKSNVIKDDYHDQLKRAMIYSVGGQAMTYVDALITGFSTNHSGSSSDAQIESISGQAKGVTLA
jgi:hypothetical protein